MPTWSQPHSGAIAHRAWCDPRPGPRGLRAWGSGVGPCPRPSLCCGASGPRRPRAARQGRGLWLSVAADHKVTRGDGLRERGPALGMECCPLRGYPRTSWGTENACVLAALREDPSGGLGEAGFTFGRAGRRPGRGGSRSTGVWGQHAEGRAWAEAEPGRPAGSHGPCGRSVPYPHGSSGLACRPGEGHAVGSVPSVGSVGRAGGLRARPQPWLWEDSASGGPRPLWTVVSPQCAGAGAVGLAVAGGLSWPRAGTAAGARGARWAPALGSQRGPRAVRPSAWPAPAG